MGRGTEEGVGEGTAKDTGGMLTYPFEFRWERERWIWERIFYRKEGMRMRDGEGARGDEGCARRKSCYWNGNKG